jgi:UDP-N-acetylmuramoyl-tripeptide--D-alanyl-D-alanine ligase
MVELRLDEIAAKMNGDIIRGDPSRVFRTFSIDSRLTQPGELFFAIRARRDGHDFVREAAEKQAGGAVVSRDIPAPDGDFALIRVPDTVAALEGLARRVLAGRPVKVVGVTGSVGKTTTKEFAASLLAHRFRVLKSEANFNNNLGLALSLLRLEPGHEVAVLEMGTSGFGEILTLTRIAPPDIAVITNINPVHLEFLRDIEGVARAKKEILQGARPDGAAVLNGDDPWVKEISRDWTGRRLTFGFGPGLDVRAAAVNRLGQEGMTFELRCLGEKADVRLAFVYQEYIYNVLAAVGVCVALDLPFATIAEGIPELRPFAKRGGLIRLAGGIRLVDDSYNSSPRALEAALKGLAVLSAGRRVAVLGDMLELGEKEAEYHKGAGRQVAENGWNILVAVGPLGRHLIHGALAAGLDSRSVFLFATAEEAAAQLPSIVREGDLILVKGSHGVHMDLITDRLLAELKET